MMSEYMSPCEVARRLNLSTDRVKRPDMDLVLKPIRTGDGRRFYRADQVEIVAAERAARAAKVTP